MPVNIPNEFALKGLEWLLYLLSGAVAYMYNSIRGNKKEVSDLKLHISENYVKKSDVLELKEELSNQLKEIREILLNNYNK